jgi:hypothetical protein
MVRLGVFHPVAGAGSILMMVGILYFVLQSLTLRKQGQKWLSVSIDVRKCSWWSICLSAIFIAAGALLIANSPAIDFDIKLPRPTIDFYMKRPRSP